LYFTNFMHMEYNIYAINSIILVCLIGALAQHFSSSFGAQYGLSVDGVLRGNQYYRLWSTLWVHDRRTDLLLNILTLLCLGCVTQNPLGTSAFLFVFLTSAVGGNMLALYVSRDDQSGRHHATGAAGGVGGVLMASLTLVPSLSLSIPGVAISFPLWPLALAFVAVSVFAIKPNQGTTHHDAHLGGTIIGLLFSPLMAPESLQTTLWLAMVFLLPTILLFYGIVKTPEVVAVGSPWLVNDSPTVLLSQEVEVSARTETHHFASVEDEMNVLLDRITQRGIHSLSDSEIGRLQAISARKKA
jgi:membrane associated rhomboid family serine protease